MKDQAVSIARDVADPATRLNLLREYLQAMALRSFHESEAFRSIAFVGGTCRRFVHDLARFSEDLDFSLTAPDAYEPVEWLKKLKRDFEFAGFDCSIKWNDRKTVHTGWLRFADILTDVELSPHRDQKLSIKLEIDTDPPSGAVTESKIIQRHLTFVCQFYDSPSLMAGKLHALISRSYPKGRDWYDFIWYRSVRPPVVPNLDMLQNALDQTSGDGILTAGEWHALVLERFAKLDIDVLINDIRPFLERPQDASLLTAANIRSLCDID